MDKELTVPKWVLIVLPKIPQVPRYLFAQFVCPSPKVPDLNEKRLHWASVVRGTNYGSSLKWCQAKDRDLFTNALSNVLLQ